ncbi:TPA: hypothetical protein ACF2KY_004836, partial [Escherichia coli]
MAGPQTTREALIAELLGDVGVLIDKTDELRASFPAAADEAAAKVKAAGQRATEDVATAATQLTRDLATQTEKLLQGVQQAAREAQAAARVVDRSARRFALLATAMGLAAGIVGG